jgi:hypothetical protein
MLVPSSEPEEPEVSVQVCEHHRTDSGAILKAEPSGLLFKKIVLQDMRVTSCHGKLSQDDVDCSHPGWMTLVGIIMRKPKCPQGGGTRVSS